MKLESLKKDKFEKFKKNEITNAMNIIGGDPVGTTIAGWSDVRDYDTYNGNKDGAGTRWDFWRSKESITNSEE
ncbi:hypothetical protein [Aquimarina rhabdastrellae]